MGTNHRKAHCHQPQLPDGSSREDLDAAIELTVSQNEEEPHEAELLKGIVKFGDMSARQVMRPRVDVVAVEKTLTSLLCSTSSEKVVTPTARLRRRCR